MTALYKWIEWAAAEIYPYGHSKLFKMATFRQLGFDVTGNSAIRSADPENPTLENQTWSVSDHPLRRYGHSRILGAYGTPFWGKERSQEVSDGTIRKSDGSFL